MEILTGEQMRRVDRRAIRDRGIPGIELMEAAGRGVADALAEEIPDIAARPVIVLCGKGNNGGDGFVAARHLARLGASPRVVLLASATSVAGDAATQLARARECGLAIEEVESEPAWERLALSAASDAVVLDAILGTGVAGGARGLAARAIDDVSRWPATIVAIDVPSGAGTDGGAIEGPVMRAHRTYTLCRPKPCLVLEPAASHAGPWRVVDIGIPGDAVSEERAELEWFDGDSAVRLVPLRPRGAHKGTMGHLLVVAGSKGKSGAAALVGRAALRSGVGLVTVAVPRSAQPSVAAAQAELMTELLPEGRSGAIAAGSVKAAGALMRGRDALALGPGLGATAEARAAAVAILERRTVPAVVDADGLNALAAGRGSLRRRAAGGTPLVLTPHPGEAARLLKTTVEAVQADRLGAARRLAAEAGGVVVLKGRRSVVAEPGGRASFNASGNPGMATAGTGDALTGVIGALLARGMTPFDAARLGTYVHGAAGDLAAERLGEDGLIAGDLVDALPHAFLDLVARRRGAERWTPGA